MHRNFPVAEREAAWKTRHPHQPFGTPHCVHEKSSTHKLRREKNNTQELQALYQQAVAFAKLLLKWNQNYGNLSFADGVIPDPNLEL